MAPNTTVALMLAAAGGVLVWTGIADPAGGITGALGSVLRGQPVATKPAGSIGLTKYVGAIWSGSASAAAPSSSAPPSTSTPSAGGSAGVMGDYNAIRARTTVISESLKLLGTKYTYGGESPATGFDCSGLVQYVYAKAGVKLPRTAAAQAMVGTTVGVDDAVPGDLIFWGVPAYHCGIALGGGKVRHAPQTGDVVKDSAIWSKGTTYARRVIAAPSRGKGTASAGVLSA